MSNFSDNVGIVSAQQQNFSQLSGRAPGVDRMAVLERMFGRPPIDPRQHYGENVNYTNYDLFHLYNGKNMYLRDTIEGFILDDIEWYIRVMPWLETADQNIKFNTYEFQTTLATPVPNEGVPRLISSTSRSFEDSVQRLGLGFIMEGDLLGTPEGEQQYRRNIAGIAQSCQETVNYHTLVALLTCKNYFREKMELFNNYDLTQERIEEREAARFAALALDEETFDRMVVEEQMRIQSHQGRADTLIVFKKFPYNESMVRQGSLTRYYQMGADGITRFVEGPQSNGTFRGEIPIFETREFTVRDNGERADPLISNTAVGEWYGMIYEFRGRPYNNFETDQRSIHLYDFDQDDYRKLSFIKALEASGAFDKRKAGGPLSEHTKALADRINARLAQTGAFEELEDYETPHEFESLDGDSNPKRSIYMMLAVDSHAKQVFPAEYLGQLDVNVYTTRDLRDAASTAAGGMFGDMQCLQWCDVVNDVFSLMKEWENVGYSSDYFEALALENIKFSVDANGKWAGEKAGGVTQWVSNAYGGLDLPTFQTGFGRWPAGMANWAGLQTYAEQAADKGWVASEDDPKLDRVRKAIDVIKELTGKMHNYFMHSEVMKKEYVSEWFSPKADTELAVFELIYMARQPLFLKAPAEGPDAPAPRGAADGQSKYDPLFVMPDPNSFLQALPLASYIARVLEQGANKDASGNSTFEEARFEDYLSALSDIAKGNEQGKTDEEKLQNAEDGRTEIVNALFRRISEGMVDKTIVKHVIAQTADYVMNNVVTVEEKNNNSKTAKSLAKAINAGTKKVISDARKKYDKADQATKKEIEDEGEILLETSFSSATTKSFGYKQKQQGQGGNLNIVNVPESISQAVLAPANDVGENYLQAVRSSKENLLRLSRKYQSISSDFSFENEAMKSWARALVASKKLGNDDIEELKQANRSYGNAVSALQTVIDEAMPAAPSTTGTSYLEQGFASAGAAVDDGIKEAKFFFRAPLTMTQELLRKISRVQEPVILPADERTGFRTYVNLWNVSGKGPLKAPFDAVRGIIGHPMLAQSDMGNKFHPKAKSFFSSSFAMANTHKPEFADEYFGAHMYTAPAHITSEYAEHMIDVDINESDYTSGAASYYTAEERFAARRAEVNRRRMQAGQAARSFDRDIAASSRRQTEQMRAELRQREYDQMHAAESKYAQDTQSMESRAASSMSATGAMFSRNPLERLRKITSALSAGAQQPGSTPMAVGHHSSGGLHDGQEIRVSQKLKKHARGHFVYRWNKVHEEHNPLLRAIMTAILMMPNNLVSWRSMANKNINPLCNIIIHRPFIELRMYTCILLQSGYEMGFNVIGVSNMTLGSTVGDKMIQGSFTFHHASMVVNEKLVSHLRNSYPMGVVAGWGLKPIQSGSELFRGTDRGDWIATLIPITECNIPRRINIIDTTVARMTPVTTNRSKGISKTADYSAASWFEVKWGINEGNINWSIDLHKYHMQGQMINVRESVGKHWRYDPTTRKFSRLVEGAGQLSDNRTGKGVKKVWLGFGDTKFPDQTQITYNLV